MCLTWASVAHERFRNEDFAKFNAREEDVRVMQSQYKQMQMRIESMEKLQADFEENARYVKAWYT